MTTPSPLPLRPEPSAARVEAPSHRQRSNRRPARRHAACVLLLGLVTFSASLPAVAQSAAELESARKHFRAARVFEGAKQWEDARRELSAAISIKETPGLRYHLAYCEEQLANYAESLDGYERAQALLNEGQKAADVAKLIGPAIVRVNALLGSVKLLLPAEPLLKLLLDGETIEPGPTPLRLNPGAHRLEAKADGFKPFMTEFVVRAGQAQDVQVALEPLPEAPATAAPSEVAPPADVIKKPDSIKPYVLLAEGVVTAAGIGLGLGYALRASKAGEEAGDASAEINRRDPQRACDNPDPVIQDACRQFIDFKTQQSDARTLSTIGFVTAGVGVASLIATWLLWPTDAATETRASQPALRGFQAGPAPGGAWVALYGAF